MLDLSPQDIQAVFLSVKVASVATILVLPFGFGVAYLLVFSHLPGRTILEGIVNLPLVLPPVVIGYLLLLFFGRNGPLAGVLSFFDLRIIFTIKGAIIASGVVGFPLLVRAIRLSMESIDPAYLQAASTLGAGWWNQLHTIILPLAWRGIIAGMTLSFARSLGEFGATIILAGNIPGVTQTIPLAIYEYTNTPGGDRMALSLCVVAILLSFVVLLGSQAATSTQKRGRS